jgi:hypothetical protein
MAKFNLNLPPWLARRFSGPFQENCLYLCKPNGKLDSDLPYGSGKGGKPLANSGWILKTHRMPC